MRTLIFLIPSMLLVLLSCHVQVTKDNDEAATQDKTAEKSYDPELAAQLGADEYGMKMYVMAFLKEGPNRDLDSAAAADLQRAHLDNISRMAEEGQLSVAGPFAADGNPVRGIYIFNVETIEEARKLTETDPAIQAGSLEMELRQWYGSAALQLLVEEHARVAKQNI